MEQENRSRTILVVEDEDQLRKVLVKKFAECGFEVLEAADGDRGLALALAEQPDLLLVDILMPVRDGVSMVKELREDEWGKEANVIVLSNSDDINNISTMMSCGVFDFLLKSSISLEQLEERVRERIRQSDEGIMRPIG